MPQLAAKHKIMTEVFIEPELANLEVAENAAEWFEICSELGLTKQLNHADRSEEKKAPPYMFIDPKTSKIIRTLCPRLVTVENYDASTIPLDILQEIAKCRVNGWYKEIKIAYDDKSPDPFVIGFTHHEHYWMSSKHLIARWGAELLPFEQLEIKAINRLKEAFFVKLSEVKATIDFGLNNPDAFVKSLLGGDNQRAISFDLPSIEGSGDLPF